MRYPKSLVNAQLTVQNVLLVKFLLLVVFAFELLLKHIGTEES